MREITGVALTVQGKSAYREEKFFYDLFVHEEDIGDVIAD